jgi:N-acetyl sugar amidotransferase
VEAFAVTLEVKYGLPAEVRFCTRCVISNQRPNSAVEFKHTAASKKCTIHFDEHGVCDACRVAEAKARLDWDARERELQGLCDTYRRHDGHYDCLVPGSGGKDSFYQSHILKYKYGMHPLTVTWAPHIYTDVGRRNHQRWIDSGLDNYLMTPNSRVHRLLTRLAVENLFHPFQPFMLGQKFLGPRMAARFGIPLVFYGENEAEYGNPGVDAQTALRSSSYHSADGGDVYLGGVSVLDLMSVHGVDAADLRAYMPPAPEDVANVQVRYLGYYLKWHPQSCYYYAHEHGGFEANPERTSGTYSKYNSIDDIVDHLHYFTTHVKFGIGRATYDAAQEIRSGDITRDDGVALVRRYDGEYPEAHMPRLMEYLSVPGLPEMTETAFMELADKFRSPHLWSRECGGWKLRHAVWQGVA